MPSYRPLISRDEFHMLETYYFKLTMFTLSDEFWRDLSELERGKISHEISYLAMYIDIVGQLFNQKGKNEKPVVAWLAETEEDYIRIFRFSCIVVASMSLGCNKSKISAVCKGKRQSTGGYVFQYEEDYEEANNFTFDVNSTEFKFT